MKITNIRTCEFFNCPNTEFGSHLKLGRNSPCCVRHGESQVVGQPAEGLGYCSRSVPEVPVVPIRWVPGVPLTGIKQ